MKIKKKPLLLCMGTRPEIIKMAPVYHELKSRKLPVQLLHTGQHKDLAEPMYEFFSLKPDHSLLLDRTANTLEHLSALLIEQIGALIADVAPKAVLVHGDTTSALMAAMAAFYQKIPVAHVEAGLRSHNSYDPFPEEKNRELIARLAYWHFAPTEKAAANLIAEGVPRQQIHVVGNTVIDAIAYGQNRLRSHPQLIEPSAVEMAKKLKDRKIILVTAHRRENWGAPLHAMASAILALIKEHPDLAVVWPVHANPEVKAAVHTVLGALDPALAQRVFLLPPIPYPALLDLLSRAWLVLTDSGGIQEEAASFHVPVLVLRETTERPELIDIGAGRLVGTDQHKIVDAVSTLLAWPQQYDAMRATRNPFGDGQAAKRIVQAMVA